MCKGTHASDKLLGRVFKAVQQVENVMRYVAGAVFVLAGFYYIGISMKLW